MMYWLSKFTQVMVYNKLLIVVKLSYYLYLAIMMLCRTTFLGGGATGLVA